MAGITVTVEGIARILGTPVSTERAADIHAATLRLIRTGYRPDPMLAEGYAAEVLESVYTSVAMRLLTNPTGARSLGLGAANVTFGGPDEDFSNVASLTPNERADLGRLTARRPGFIRHRALTPTEAAWGSIP